MTTGEVRDHQRKRLLDEINGVVVRLTAEEKFWDATVVAAARLELSQAWRSAPVAESSAPADKPHRHKYGAEGKCECGALSRAARKQAQLPIGGAK